MSAWSYIMVRLTYFNRSVRLGDNAKDRLPTDGISITDELPGTINHPLTCGVVDPGIGFSEGGVLRGTHLIKIYLRGKAAGAWTISPCLDSGDQNPVYYQKGSESCEMGEDLPLRVVCGVCEDPDEESSANPIATLNDHTLCDGFKEVVVE